MDLNEAFARIKKANKNVSDIVVINKDNFIVGSSDDNIAKQMPGLIRVVEKCRAAFKEDDDLTFLKIRTKRSEYLVVPDKEYMLVASLDFESSA